MSRMEKEPDVTALHATQHLHRRGLPFWARHAGAVVVAALVLQPYFFITYRMMVFNTVPRDDYAPFLLWLAGAPGGVFPGSPYGYRVLTMVAAWPLYAAFPPLRLTNMPADIALPYLQATAAIAALSFLCTIVAGLLGYRIARDKAGFGRAEAVMAAALLFLACGYSQFFGIDPVSIMLVAACVALLHRPRAFAGLVVASVLFNEKVAIVLALWLTIRWLLVPADRRAIWRQCAAALGAVLLYGLILAAIRMPGHEYQLRPLGYGATFLDNLGVLLSGRGVVLDIVPVIMLALSVAAGWRRGGSRLAGGMFRRTDMLVIPGLVLVALVLTQMFQVGRIVMHAAPLFAVPVAAGFAAWAGGKRRG
jgi:hypothetical protein